MKPKIVVCLSLVLSGVFIGCASFVPITDATRTDVPPVLLSWASYNFDRERSMRLSFIWVEGKHFVDDQEWCGEGEKYTGKFIFRVELFDAQSGNKTVDTSLDSLYPNGGSFDFISASAEQPWEIKMADYNNDGQLDFNLITYGACTMDACWLFTVNPSGKVEVLKIDGKEDLLAINKLYDHSVPDFNLTPTGFYYERFDRPEGASYLEFLDWDAKQKTFHSHEQKIVLRQ